MEYYRKDIIESLPFNEFLKEMLTSIKNLKHMNKSDNTYYKAEEAVRIIKDRFISENNWTWEQYDKAFETKGIRLSAKLLNRYNLKSSDKKKMEVIEDFVDNYCTDLDNIIFRLEYVPEKPSDPTV